MSDRLLIFTDDAGDPVAIRPSAVEIVGLCPDGDGAFVVSVCTTSGTHVHLLPTPDVELAAQLIEVVERIEPPEHAGGPPGE